MSNNRLMARARDELFSHINRCGVLEAAEKDQIQWMKDTIEFIAERYVDLSEKNLLELHEVGLRFCKPAIPHGSGPLPGISRHETDEANAAYEAS